MADRSPYPDSNDDTLGPDLGSPSGTPLWVKVFGIIALVVLMLLVIVTLTGGGGSHGPGRHTGSDGGDMPPSSVRDHGPPKSGHTP